MDQQSLEDQIDALDGAFAQTSAMAAGFDAELKRIHQTFAATGKQAEALEKTFSGGLKRAIDGVVLNGFSLTDALEAVSQSLINAAYNSAVKPVTEHFGSMLARGTTAIFGGMSPFADGGAFTQGRVTPFANGGVVNGPVTFPMRGGTGLMGEAGPEAIMPLTRGADGKLGVRAQGGGQPVTVVMNITTPDVSGFQRSQSQIAAQASRALARAHRNS
ncbi:phage tail tape measure protein [Pseudaestuariivita sp.]|uniref:phage tail tape measure protein n=1 Tax=Pseudaestuariivita sp. TaxID=2211669 RepID=UPI0040587CB1